MEAKRQLQRLREAVAQVDSRNDPVEADTPPEKEGDNAAPQAEGNHLPGQKYQKVNGSHMLVPSQAGSVSHHHNSPVNTGAMQVLLFVVIASLKLQEDRRAPVLSNFILRILQEDGQSRNLH